MKKCTTEFPPSDTPATTYRQLINERLPEPFRTQALENTPDERLEQEVRIRTDLEPGFQFVSTLFAWSDSPQGHDYWSRVRCGDLSSPPQDTPPAPTPEARLDILESRIAVLEGLVIKPEAPDCGEVAIDTSGNGYPSTPPDPGPGYRLLEEGETILDGDEEADGEEGGGWSVTHKANTGGTFTKRIWFPVRRKLPARYPTTPLPEGFDRWECRGLAWEPGRRVVYTVINVDSLETWPVASEGTPRGFDNLEYWEAVKDGPVLAVGKTREAVKDGLVLAVGKTYKLRNGDAVTITKHQPDSEWLWRGDLNGTPHSWRGDGSWRLFKGEQDPRDIVSELPPAYRLLNPGETILASDEVYLRDEWEEMAGDEGVGETFDPKEDHPIRRRIKSYEDA